MAVIRLIVLSTMIGLICSIPVVSAQGVSTNQTPQVIDRVAAVVGDEIILLSEVQEHVRSLMMDRGMDNNASTQELQRLLSEVLNAMIDDRLLLVKAEQDSIQIDSALANESERYEYQRIKSNFRSDAEYEQALQELGMTDQQLRNMIREAVIKDQLQQIIMQTISRSISVTPQDMEAWAAAYADSVGEMPAQYRLSHILRYPQVSPERKASIRNRLENIRQQILDGADFAEMAKEYTEDPGGKTSGGDLGYFTRNVMVSDFSDAAFSLSVGQVSDIVETDYGYHIIKVEDIRGDQIRARHILLILEPNDEDDQESIDLLNQIREEILAGNATFEAMAREYSEDENSSALGGRLQWLQRNNIIPEFMAQTDSLEIGGISKPFRTDYGFHILRFDNFRPAHKLNVRDDSQDIRNAVMNEKSMAELERILNELRGETYIRISLE